jgi:hypothetical protein
VTVGAHPTYTKRQKVTAVIAAEMTSARAAAKATGIPHQTVARWQDDPELRHIVAKTRDQLADDMKAVAALAVEYIVRDLRAGRFEPRDLTILLGVATDKAQLLAGMATSRTESRDLTGTIDDAELAAAIREAEALAGGGSSSPSK